MGCRTAIAHSIREQVFAYKKSLYLVGHTSDASNVQDEELRQAFLPSLTSGARPSDQVAAFTPSLYYASDGEIERSEKEREREMNKRRKRNTRGRRGVALPDRDPIRTYRTPAIGFPELDPAALAAAAAASAPTSRRAAAAAASLTIANMVANENGSPPFTPAQLPGTSGGQQQQAASAPIKEKKVNAFLEGKLTVEEVFAKMRREGKKSDKEISDLEQLAREIQYSVITKQLKPGMSVSQPAVQD